MMDHLLVKVACLSLAVLLRGAAGTFVEVDIPGQGTIRGLQNATERVFMGIPFSQAPVGALRFAPPQAPHAAWSGVRDGTYPRAGCIQDCLLPPHTCPPSISEDCLFLDVYTPLPDGSKKLKPVMFFIPGGRFEQGAGNSFMYAGTHLVNRSGVVLVTTNYRLGALGFLATNDVNGNFGIQDQRAALKWVRANIKAFGGDPAQVTVFGQSAGAASTAVHVTSPLSKGLFRAAIIESDPWTLPMKTLDVARKLGKRFVTDVGCSERHSAESELACLRNVSWSKILTEQKVAESHIPLERPLDLFMPWVPTVDGVELTDQPRNLIAQGKWNEVPLMTGTVANEALLFIWQADKKAMGSVEYAAVATTIFKEDVFKVLKEYPDKPLPTATGEDRRSRLAQLGTDYIFACPERHMLNGLVNKSSLPIYRYQFQHHMKADIWGPLYAECDNPLYVCHGSELPFVFGNVHPFYTFTTDELALTAYLQTAWSNFAITGGNPNLPQAFAEGWPQWKAFSEDKGVADNFMALKTPIAEASTHELKSKCDFWDEMGYDWGLGS